MAVEPPARLRARTLAAATRYRAPGDTVPPVAPVDALTSFRRRAGALAALLRTLPPGGWELPVPPYPWTVHGLVGHLEGVERYVGGLLGLWAFEPTCAERDHIGLTEPFVAAATGTDPAVTGRRWWTLVTAVADHVEGLGPAARAQPLPFHGYPFTLGSALVARSFELWTHADDVRRATGRTPAPPAPGELAAIADLSVRNLPAASLLVAPHQAGRPARVVLTGPGGGTWRLGPPDRPAAVRVVMDVVEYCRMAARRLDPGAATVEVAGDADLARDLFAAARLLAA